MSKSDGKNVLQSKGEPKKQCEQLPKNDLGYALVLIVLNSVVTPRLRNLVEEKLKPYYNELVKKHNINTEDNDLFKIGKSFRPNYGSLIYNQKYAEENSYQNGVKTCNWKYAVRDYFELARLFIEPNMAWYQFIIMSV